MGILHNVLDGCGQTCTVGQLDDAIVLQQQQRPGFVGGVVGNRDDITVGNVTEGSLGARIDAEGLIVDARNGHQMGTLFGIEVVEVRDMLEVVGVDFAAVHYQIGLHIVFKLGDLQRPAFLGKDFGGFCQNLRVRHGRGGYGDGALFLNGSGGLRRGGNHTALNYQGVLVILAVGVQQSSLIVGVEEVLVAQGLDLVIQPAQ